MFFLFEKELRLSKNEDKDGKAGKLRKFMTISNKISEDGRVT